MTQFAFSDAEMGMGRKRGTRRPRLPDRPSESCPWDAWLALAGEARSADAGARGADSAMGRPRVGDLVLPRMHVARACLGLSDRECEDQVWDPATMRPFVGVAPFEVPDATTPREFRHLPGRCGVGKAMVSSALRSVAEGGLAAGRRQEALAGRRGRPGRRGRQVGRSRRRRARLPLGQGHVRAAGDALQRARQGARPGLRRRRRSRSHDRGAGTAALRAAPRAVGGGDGPATREARGAATEGGGRGASRGMVYHRPSRHGLGGCGMAPGDRRSPLGGVGALLTSRITYAGPKGTGSTTLSSLS